MSENRHLNKTAALKRTLQRTITGRDKQISAINKQLRIMLQNECTLTIVGGGPGVGKTALVKTALEDITDANVACVYGKFEQYKNNKPYVAIIQIIEEITNHMMTLPEERLKKIQKKLLSRLGKDAALLTKVAPRAQRLLEWQTSFKGDSYQKVKLRLEKAIKIFIQSAAAELYPFVIFLDDLQWADSSSMDIIRSIMASFKELGLNMILAYRTNREDRNGNMQEIKCELRGKAFVEIHLENILPRDIEKLLSIIFEDKLDEMSELSRLLYGKTMGNPLLIKQTILLLLDSGDIYFDLQQEEWVLDIVDTVPFGLSHDIEDIVESKVEKLSTLSKELLEYTACIGNCITVDLLKVATGYDTCILEEALEIFCDIGLIIENGCSSRSETTGEYVFLHDKIANIVYEQISSDRKEHLHFQIALSLFNDSDQNLTSEHLLYVMAHFLKCKNVVQQRKLNGLLIEPLYLAGLQAKQLAAAEHAIEFFAYCEVLLYPSCWENDYNRTLAIKLELAQCEFVSGFCDESEEHFKEILSHAESQTDLAKIKKHYMVLNYYVGEYDVVIEQGLQALSHLGFGISMKGLNLQIVKEIFYSKLLFRKNQLENIRNASFVKDNNIFEVLEILSTMIASVSLSNKDLFLLIVLKISNLSAKHGNTPYAALGYAAYCLILGSILGDYEAAERVENISLALIERSEDDAIKCQTYFVIGAFVHHWNHPAEQSLLYLYNSFDAGVQSGEFLYAGFSITAMLELLYFTGRPLDTLDKVLGLREQYGQKINHDIVLRLVNFFETQINMLTNGTLDDSKDDTNSGTTYDLLKIQRLYLEGNIYEAFNLSQKAILQLDLVTGYYIQVEFVFYFLLLNNQMAKKKEKFSFSKGYKKYKKILKVWAKRNPENHMARYLLIEALSFSRRNKLHDAVRLFDKAIEYARKSQNLFLEALGNYLAAEFHGMNRQVSIFYAKEARRLFSEWGSEKTAARVAAQFSIASLPKSKDKKNTGDIYRDNETPEGEDSISFAERSLHAQKKMESLDLEAAYAYSLDYICVNVAADRGTIFLEQDSKTYLKYTWTELDGSKRNDKNRDAAKIKGIPKSVIRYVSRTYEEVLIPKKPWEGQFTADGYFKNKKEISVLCLPLKYKGVFVGLIYLESWSDYAFTRIDVNFIRSLLFYLVAKEALEKEIELSSKSVTLQMVEQLTSRETEVLNCLATGMSNKEIANKLGIKSSTVKTHTLRIYRKLDVSSRLQAVIKASQLRLLQ